MSPADVAQRQLDAYNGQDVDAFCACFAPECVIADLNGAISSKGIDAIRARYAKLFADFPQNHARLINRIAVGDLVVDHEDVTRRPGEGFKCAALYTVRDGLIVRVDFVRET